MKLYHYPQSRAAVSKWMLDEAGAQYELVPIDLKKGEHKTPEFLKINPAGKLPTLVDGETRVFEGPAIAMYIAERYPEAKLAPSPGSPQRGRYLSLMVYATAQLEPAMVDRMLKQEPSNMRGWTNIETALDVVEKELGPGPWLFGEQFTAADVSIGATFIWMRHAGMPSGRPALEAYVDRLLARPHCVKMGG